ncbi:hypothetical protein H6P81_000110 [Aristolochia fimbriata]|uniref:BHLH domain-containing protein n=1 Tax=Aristolochia fimbriata TaxID=158543 RepID=A0AAV7F3C8_ARIFI|nr:hypothetical protein H6P81_000110 [Aristolochia fimbriata]
MASSSHQTCIPLPSDSGGAGDKQPGHDALLSEVPIHIVTHPSQLPPEFLEPSIERMLVIGFDCEGVDLCRYGTLCIMQLAFPDAVYLVDATQGGQELMQACKPALESNYVTKVVHDCKRDSEALYFQFGIKLNNVMDTQIAYSLLEEQEGRKRTPDDYISFVGLLADPRYCGISYLEKEEVRILLRQDPMFWTYRPLSELMIRAAGDDVRFLLYIYHKMMEKLNERSLWLLSLRGSLYCRCFCISDNNYEDWPSLPAIPDNLVAEGNVPEEEILSVLNVPQGKMGIIIGRKGASIMSIKVSCDAEILMGGAKGPPDKVFIIGPVKQVRKAEAILRGRTVLNKQVHFGEESLVEEVERKKAHRHRRIRVLYVMMETTLGNWPRDENPPENTTAPLDHPPLWSNKYNLRELSCDNNMDLITEALFSSSSGSGVLVLEEAPGTKTSINSNIIDSNYSNISNSNSNIVEREEIAAAPGPEYYSIFNGAASSLNLSSQRGQDAARVGGMSLAKYWEYSPPSSQSPPLPPPPLDFIADSVNGGVQASDSSIRPLFSNGVLLEDDSNNYKVVRFSADHHSSSLDNCLLSASNSGTDKSVEEDDDGISLLFSSDCNHLYNWNNLSAASSGESEINNGSNYYEITSKTSNGSKRSPGGGDEKRPPPNINSSDSNNDHHYLGGDLLLQSSKGSADHEGGFRLINSENVPSSRWSKKPRSEKYYRSNNISFRHPNSSWSNSGSGDQEEPDTEAIAQMKEMIYRAAAFRPVNFGVEAVVLEKPKRKNVRISNDPQTVAARQRRERISQRIRVLQRLVPGGSKMDTASMLDEAANYLKFLKSQVTALEKIGGHKQLDSSSSSSSSSMNNNYATSLAFSPNFINHTILPMQTFLLPHHKP